MKISFQQVRAFEDYIQSLEDGNEKKYARYDLPYYAERPHLLMTMGFDEYVSFKNKAQFQKYWFAGDVEDCPQSIYRRPSGQWFMLYGTPVCRDDTFRFHTKRSLQKFDRVDSEGGYPFSIFALRINLQDLFRKLYKIANKPIEDQKTLWSPTLWTPSAQKREQLILRQSTRGILRALRNEKVDLASLTWRQLEEIVAEILRASGLEIHVVKENPQGGRDIIARGELIPGQEPITLAVEVKHRPIVGRGEVQKALWQNRQWPALLFVTSGRFTGGVLREKSLPENQLRLFLKDGEALGDLIRDCTLE
jgi:hypothetical protein